VSELRAEAARIARDLRRHLERGHAEPGGELLARGARAAARGPAVEARTRASATPAAGRAVVDPRPDPAAVRAALPPEVDLFGKPLAPATHFPTAVAEPDVVQVRTAGVHPIDPAARLALTERSLPVLSEVAVEARACTLCALCSTRTQAVPGVGSALSGIVFVGEAPGSEEDRRGEPFVGRAGELLTRIIKAMDDAQLIPGVRLSRDTVYICNVLKCRPPENRNPLPHEVESCAPYLRRQLAALQPRVICCLGKFAAELLVGVKGSIGGLRGKVYRYEGAKLIVTYHPAFLLRSPTYKRPVWEDMQLLAREYQTD
jgi:uracil-DNA glycosylase